MSNNPIDEYYRLLSSSSLRSPLFSGLYGEPEPERKYSWTNGLRNCPKCDKDVTGAEWYCKQCEYGKKQSTTKKAPKIDGYDWVITSDYPHGIYIRKPNKNLFSTVIIEDYKKQMILEALSIVENQKLVFEDWGFNEVMEKGKGVSFLFWGDPGTGKTLMGEAIAQFLGKELEVITASTLMDKYVGETEKKISSLFSGSVNKVLLFDECDSLLGDRAFKFFIGKLTIYC